MVNGLSHRYHLGKSTVILRGIGFDFYVLFNFSMTFSFSKQKSPRCVRVYGCEEWTFFQCYVMKFENKYYLNQFLEFFFLNKPLFNSKLTFFFNSKLTF